MSKMIRKLSGLVLALSLVLISGGCSLFGDGSPSNSELKEEFEKKVDRISKASTEIREMVQAGGKPFRITSEIEIIKGDETASLHGVRVRIYMIKAKSEINPIYVGRFSAERKKKIDEAFNSTPISLQYVMTDKGWVISPNNN